MFNDVGVSDVGRDIIGRGQVDLLLLKVAFEPMVYKLMAVHG